MTNKPESAAVEAVAMVCLVPSKRYPHFAGVEIQLYGGYEPVIGDTLVPQSALDALRGEVERKSIEIDRFMDKWAAEIRRADAAERRVEELLAAIKEYRLFASCGNREAIARLDALTKESP